MTVRGGRRPATAAAVAAASLMPANAFASEASPGFAPAA